VDPLTHALASYSLKRAAFPRATRPATIAILAAGILADLDGQSFHWGPSAFLTLYRTYFHSVIAAVLLSLAVTLPFLLRKREPGAKHVPPASIFIAALAAALLHLLMDVCQSAGVELFWPFSARRFAFDCVAHLDLWLLGLLLAGILLPTLSGLVTEEIGAKSKGPRGRIGACLALAVMVLYIGVRFVLHSDALAAMESRTYRGQSPRRVAAFAESGSPFRWHGIVETDSALHELEVSVGPGANLDPDSAVTSYKPEPSPALDAARNTLVARRFLRVARFPKASVEKTPEGFQITLRDFPYTRDVRSGLLVQATIDTDPVGKVISQQPTWNPLSQEFWWE